MPYSCCLPADEMHQNVSNDCCWHMDHHVCMCHPSYVCVRALSCAVSKAGRNRGSQTSHCYPAPFFLHFQEQEAACKRAQAEERKLKLATKLQKLQQEATSLEEQRQAQREQFQVQLQALRLEKQLALQVWGLAWRIKCSCKCRGCRCGP